jgi:hypothetical protein
MLWRSVAVFVFSISVFTTTACFSSPIGSDQHHRKYHAIEPWLPPARLVRPNNDSNYIGWSRLPGAGRDCPASDAFGCSRGQVGGRVSRPPTAGGWVYFGPQYTFVPGRGVVDEACNLPTSACPNTQRDGQ